MLNKHRIKIISALIIVLIIVIAIAMLFKTPSELSAPVHFESDDERQQLTQSVDQKISIFGFQLKNKQGDRASLELDEKSLNAYVQSSPRFQEKLRKIGAQNPVVKIHKDLIRVGMRIPLHGAMLPATADIEVRQIPGRKLIVNIKEMKIGGYPAPRSIIDKIAGKELKSGIIDLPPEFRNIEVNEGKILVEANPRSS